MMEERSAYDKDQHFVREDDQMFQVEFTESKSRLLTNESETKDGQVVNADVDTSSEYVRCNENVEIEELVEEIQEFHQEQDLSQDDSNEHRNAFINADDRTLTMKHAIVIISDCSKFVTPVGLVKIFILVSCTVSLICACTTDYQFLTLSNYIRFQIFSLTFAFLMVLTIFLMEILSLISIFPVHWAHLNAVIHFGICLLLNASSSKLLHEVFINQSNFLHTGNTIDIIIACGVSGHCGALLCLLISISACCCYDHHLLLPWNPHSEGVLMLK